jgi:hypothetical protein
MAMHKNGGTFVQAFQQSKGKQKHEQVGKQKHAASQPSFVSAHILSPMECRSTFSSALSPSFAPP